jgi:transposase InsO family protein
VNLAGTFYYLCSILDGATRFLVHWEVREPMTTADVETVIQRAREHYPDARRRLISDNGPQFIARDFKEFIRLAGMTHVRTSPYYPQSNGKLARWQQTLKVTAIRSEGPERSRKRGGWWRGLARTTITGACMARSASSRRRTCWPAAPPPSGPHATGSSKPLALAVAPFDRHHPSQRL